MWCCRSTLRAMFSSLYLFFSWMTLELLADSWLYLYSGSPECDGREPSDRGSQVFFDVAVFPDLVELSDAVDADSVVGRGVDCGEVLD